MFSNEETASYVKIPLKECLLGILSAEGGYKPKPLMEQLPLQNGPSGDGPEMRASNGHYYSAGVTDGGTIIVTHMWKRYYNEYALLSMIDRHDPYRVILRRMLTKLGALANWKYVNSLHVEMLHVIDEANAIFDDLYATPEMFKYWTARLICSFNALLSAYKENMYDLIREIDSLNGEDYTELSWGHVMGAYPVAKEVLCNVESYWWQIDDAYAELLEMFRRLELLEG